MDPNVALAKAREAAGELLHADDDGNFTDPETTNLGQLIESFNALDEWITKGGFLPTDWQAKSPEPRRRPDAVGARKVLPHRQVVCSSHDTQDKCDSTESKGGHYYLRAGDLAWYDALWGPAKVKIVKITPDRKVYFEFTADSGAYKKGNHEESSIIYVFPRSALNVRRQRWDGVPVWFEVTSDDEA